MHHLTTNSLYQLLGAVFRSDKKICQSCCIECSPTAFDPPGTPEWGFQQCTQVLSPLPARYPNSETSRTSVLSLISTPSRALPPWCLAGRLIPPRVYPVSPSLTSSPSQCLRYRLAQVLTLLVPITHLPSPLFRSATLLPALFHSNPLQPSTALIVRSRKHKLRRAAAAPLPQHRPTSCPAQNIP